MDSSNFKKEEYVGIQWPKKELGRTGLLVAPICWGCAPLGDIPEVLGYRVAEEEAIKALLAAFGSQINFLDTSNSYGASEERIGKALEEIGGLPKGFILATKADRNLQTNDFSAAQIRKSVKESIRRLGIGPLQLVYLHDPEYDPLYDGGGEAWFEKMMAQGGPVAELERMKEEGLILNIGISGGPIDMLLKFIKTGRFAAVITHNRWNLLWQLAEPLIEVAYQMGMGIVNAAPYASGILATGPVAGALAAYHSPSEEIVERVKRIEAACKKYDVPLAAAALQFSLRDPRITSTAVGISEHAQVEETLRLASLPISDMLWEEIKKFVITDTDPEKDRWVVL